MLAAEIVYAAGVVYALSSSNFFCSHLSIENANFLLDLFFCKFIISYFVAKNSSWTADSFDFVYSEEDDSESILLSCLFTGLTTLFLPDCVYRLEGELFWLLFDILEVFADF